MQFKKTVLAMTMLGAAATAQADYRAEISASLGSSTVTREFDVDGDYEIEDKTSHFDVEGTFYISPVQTANVPLGEAAFLSKASSINVWLSRDDVEHEEDDSDEDYDHDDDMNAIGGSFVVPNVGLILDVGLGRGKTSDYFEDADIDLTLLGFGSYIGNNIALTLHYVLEETEYDDGYDEDHTVWTFTYSQYIPLHGEMALKIEPYLEAHNYETDSSDEDALALGSEVKFYINRQLDVYVQIEVYGRDEDEYEESWIASRAGIDYFINEQFKIGAALYTLGGEGEVSGSDGFDYYSVDFDTTGAGLEFNAAVRF